MAQKSRPAFQTPLQAQHIDGEVVVTGPEHMHGAFSVEAARESAKILEDLAERAGAPVAEPGDQSSQTGASEA